MANRKAIAKCLAVLQGQWPQIAPTEVALASWSMGLARFTDEQVTIGTELVVRYHTYGQPTAAHIAEMIEGKEVRRQIDETTRPWAEWMAHGVAYETVRVFAWEEHGDPPPCGLTAEDARRRLLGGEDTPPQLTGSVQ